ncbi:RING-box protein 1 [Prunus yedoensis var. nudiflora]|uniref:RING-type E3 ubiquitin transferase n=1 Tax=Prunus yedoensis var. nudiflora TaxID=2094558 RepID=A0A314YYU9_PRUYE|nr:RING-box protein 1 [Prunus yedoensis var. nudiflora]
MRTMRSQELTDFHDSDYEHVRAIDRDDQTSSNAPASVELLMEEAWTTKWLWDEHECHCQLCTICLEGLSYAANSEEANSKEMPCKQKFHSSCIRTWLARRGSCPLCRSSVKPVLPMNMPLLQHGEEEDEEVTVWINIVNKMDKFWFGKISL